MFWDPISNPIAAWQVSPPKTVCIFRNGHYSFFMPLTNLAVAEKALSLSPLERADLAKLLIESLESDSRLDAEIRFDLKRRLDNLVSGMDHGLNFDQVFGRPA
jgi:hypothetical protein